MKALFFGFFILPVLIRAQVVCDTITKEFIPFVTVLNQIGSGTITDENGRFPSKELFRDYDYLEFSHLTYQKKRILEKTLLEKDTIFLSPLIVELNEVIVTNFFTLDTLTKAIKRIPENYLFEPFNLYGFYRESVEEDNIGAALTEVSFIGYNKKSEDNLESYQTEIVQGRRTDNYTTFNLDPFGGVAAIIQNADLVRQETRMFSANNITDYKFSYKGKLKSSEYCIYIIDYEPANDDIYNNNSGTIFIESGTLAILQIETKKDPFKMRKVTDVTMPKKSRKPLFILREANALIKYRQVNGKYHLSFVDVDNIVEGVLGNQTYTYNMNAKYILTKVETSTPRKLDTNYNVKTGFNHQVKHIPKLAEWTESNTLFFSEKEKKILNEIKKRED